MGVPAVGLCEPNSVDRMSASAAAGLARATSPAEWTLSVIVPKCRR